MKKVTKQITVEQIELELDEKEVQAIRTVRHLIPQLEEGYCDQFEECQDCPLSDAYSECLARSITASMDDILKLNAVKEEEN